VDDVEQLGFDGMPQRLYACTPTRLATWLDCPRRYRLSYLDRPAPVKGPPWAHNSLGAAVHNALAAWWRLPVGQRTPTRAGALLVSGWLRDGFRDDAQSARWQERGRAMVERYVEGLDPYDEPVGVERTVAARTGSLALSGRVDRLDLRRDGDDAEVVVVDYKTGRRVPTADDARSSLALAVYAVAAERVLRRRSRRVELHHVPTGTVVAHEHTAETLERHVRRAESVAAEAAVADAAYRRGLDDVGLDATFPARPGTLCAWCDFARHCPEGRAAAPPREPWDGLGAA
jgi:RecB family exonuclease